MPTVMTQQHAGVTTASGLDVLAGLWLVLAPFLLGYSGTPLMNDIIIGLAVAVFAGSRLLGDGYKIAWPSWVNVLLGLWLFFAPFTLGYTEMSTALWNDVILGIVVVVLATISALSTPRDMSVASKM